MSLRPPTARPPPSRAPAATAPFAAAAAHTETDPPILETFTVRGDALPEFQKCPASPGCHLSGSVTTYKVYGTSSRSLRSARYRDG